MKKYKIIRAKNSIIFKLVIGVIVAFIPLTIFLLFMTSYSLNSAENKMINENKNTVSLFLHQVDYSLDFINKQLSQIAFDDSDYQILSKIPLEKLEDENIYTLSKVSLLNKYNQILKHVPLVDSIYTYFEDKDLFMVSANGNNKINQYILALIKDNEIQQYASGWQMEEYEGVYYLIKISRNNGGYYGAWIEIDGLMKNLGLKEPFMFTSSSGLISSQLPDSFEYNESLHILDQLNQSTDWYVFQQESQHGDFFLTLLNPKAEFSMMMPLAWHIIRILIGLSIGIIPITIFFLNKWVMHPINQLQKAMRIVESGEVTYRIKEESNINEFYEINKNFNQMMDHIAKLQLDVCDGKIKQQKVQLRYLSQKIQPHFILNTLNIIYSYEPEEYELIQQMILYLVKYFRYLVAVNSEYIEVSKELDHINNYLLIQKIRYPDKFDFKIDCEEDLESILIPPLIVQNFAENTMKYALQNEKKIQLTIYVKKIAEHQAKITISDTGNGFKEQQLIEIQKFLDTGIRQPNLGEGIQNVIERLQIIYGNHSKLQFSNNKLKGAHIEITVPIHKKEESVFQ